jgi:hypothetical protein
MPGIFDALTATTITNYKKGAIDSVIENNVLLSKLFSTGRVQRKQGGDALEGNIQAGQYTPRISTPGEDRSGKYNPASHYKRWRSQWAETSVEGGVDFGVLRRNSGPQALVDVADRTMPGMFKSLLTNGSTSLSGLLLGCNSAAYTGTGLPIDGLPTILPGASTQHTVAQAITAYDLEGFNPDTGALTGAAPADSDIEVSIGNAPTLQNYAGLTMKYNSLTGVDGLKADAWTPTLVNSSATQWSGTPDDEANAILKFSQHTVNRAGRFSGTDNSFRPAFGITTQPQLNQMGNKLDGRQTIMMTPGMDSSNKFGSGFKSDGMIYHAGIWWHYDQLCPAGRGFVINTEQTDFFLQPVLDTIEKDSIPQGFNTSGGGVDNSDLIESHIHFDHSYLRLVCAALINGQVRWHPRYNAAWDGYS